MHRLLPWLAVLLLHAPTGWARPGAEGTQVVVVLKQAACPVCAGQLRRLSEAGLGVSVVGITHDPPNDAARVAAATGVPAYSHPEGMVSLGLWAPGQATATPAVVVYDRCGTEVGRIVGRAPGRDATEAVRALVGEAEAVTGCGVPLS